MAGVQVVMKEPFRIIFRSDHSSSACLARTWCISFFNCSCNARGGGFEFTHMHVAYLGVLHGCVGCVYRARTMCNSNVMKNISSTSMASETSTEGETDGDTRTAVTIWDQELWMSPYCQIPWTAMTTIMCVHMRVCVCMCVCDVGVRKVVACVCVCVHARKRLC